ncbi:MAG: PEP-CTERM sorting domain-containing protein [Bryobacteraceae bacterium]|nr:PEP-CTERM sorting domain-containing protein [Bryobacteraceae bacterium]
MIIRIALPLLIAALAWSAPISPVSYSMLNGQGNANGGTFNYWDETYSGVGNPFADSSPLSGGLGQLTDGIVSCSDDWAANCGEGPAYRWVGWQSIDPVITFDFGDVRQFTNIGIHTNNFVSGGVSLWASALFRFSNDGIVFGDDLLRLSTTGERADTTARFLNTPLERSGRYVQISLTDGNGPWVFVSEIAFEGLQDEVVPEPSTFLLAGAAIALAALFNRRRR